MMTGGPFSFFFPSFFLDSNNTTLTSHRRIGSAPDWQSCAASLLKVPPVYLSLLFGMMEEEEEERRGGGERGVMGISSLEISRE